MSSDSLSVQIPADSSDSTILQAIRKELLELRVDVRSEIDILRTAVVDIVNTLDHVENKAYQGGATRRSDRDRDRFDEPAAREHSQMYATLKSKFDDQSHAERQRAERRSSNIYADAKSLEIMPAAREPIMYAQQPPYDHIKLVKVTITAFVTFLEEIRKYQYKYLVKLRVAPLVSDRVRGLLVNHARSQFDNPITENTFFQLDFAEITALMKLYCMPQNKQEFYYWLNRSVSFELPSNYKMEVTNFLPMYEALNALKEQFLRVHDFLVSNDSDNIPPCNNKEGGLVRILTNKVSNKYIEGVLQAIGKHSFQNAHEMWKEIFALVDKDNSRTRDARLLSHRFMSSSPRDRFDPPKQANKALANMSQFDEAIDDDERLLVDDLVVEANDQLQQLSDEEETSELQMSLAVVTNESKPKEPNACQRMLLYGTCVGKASCRYSHNDSDLKSYWSHMNKLLQTSKFKPTVAVTNQLRHVTINSDSALALIYQSSLYNLLPTASILRAVYKCGEVALGLDRLLTVPKVLMDTGALSANYIDSNFIEKHKELLLPFVKDCKLSVRLGDYETVREIKAIAHLEMIFKHGDLTFKIKDKFQVLNMHGSNDVIVGLPTIVRKLARLFQLMLEDVSRSFDESELHDQVNSLCAVSQNDLDTAIEPWNVTREEAPEELATYEPCAFTYPLHFMGMSRDEAIQEYHSQLDEHVCQEMAKATPIIELLKSPKAMTCFVPDNWEGIKGVPPLELEFKEDIPIQKAKVRPMNPRLAADAEKEMKRLCQYHFRKSTSPYASPLVIAPKATKPFIRFCGDYVWINKYIVWRNQIIPVVRHEIERIIKHTVFIDVDMQNSFHQIVLGDKTSRMLSLVTPWGQVEPKFLPEGVTPASGILQELVSEIFGDYLDWMIVIFDNLLILAHDYNDAFDKFNKLLDRCVVRNVKLKFAKTWIGHASVKFFGYLCRHNSYEITPDRIDGINKIPFPNNTKKMLSFLGMTLFASRFIQKYVEYSSPLYDMTKKGFSWDESTWLTDYRAAFERMKEAVKRVATLFYPDYELPFVLETDWSKIGVSAKLVQVRSTETAGAKEFNEELIGLICAKMSGSAQNWDPMKGEAYGVYFGVKGFQYYLRGKEFYLKTDHANLRYIESSTVPIIVRWHQYLQTFKFKMLIHPGEVGFVSDYYSRLAQLMHTDDAFSLSVLSEDLQSNSDDHYDNDFLDLQLNAASAKSTANGDELHKGPDYYLRLVHGGRSFHHGTRRTWLLLNEQFPGHAIPYAYVNEFVSKCARCQKNRLGMTDNISPVVRHIKVEHCNKRVCIDTLFITPADIHGNCVAHIVVNTFTHHVAGYPKKANDSLGVADALFQYQCTFGLAEEWLCDPASNFTADVISHLAKWFGNRQLFTLVDRHEANGVEGSNKIVMRHLYALCSDEDMKSKWSDSTVWPLVIHEVNSWKTTETPYSALQLTFGSASEIYHKLPANANTDTQLHEYVSLLDSNLTKLRAITKKFQEQLILKRTSVNPPQVNKYQPGDFILYDQSKPFKASKLTPRFAGPFEVIKHESNNVECRHLVGAYIKTFHVTDVKIFHGDRAAAYKAALEDNNQSVIRQFIAHRGDPLKRTTMQFQVIFDDGEVLWLPWTQEIFATTQYEDYCRSRTSLYVLIFTQKEADAFVKNKKRERISLVEPGDTVFVDLRSYGDDWYHSLGLPKADAHSYVVLYEYTQWVNNAKRTLIRGHCSTFNETFDLDHYFVFSYGSCKLFDSSVMILVDVALIAQYPRLKPTKK